MDFHWERLGERFGLAKTSQAVLVLMDSDGFYDECWWTETKTFNTYLQSANETASVYPEIGTTLASVYFSMLSVVGSVLNFLMIISLLKAPAFRKEYLTPTLVSISIGDFILSIYVLPILSSSYYIRYDFFTNI